MSKALSIADNTHPWVRLVPGMYSPATGIVVTNQSLTLVGTGATIAFTSGVGGAVGITAGNASNLTIRGLTCTAQGTPDCFHCQTNPGLAALTLREVSAGGTLLTNNCQVTVRQSVLSGANFAGNTTGTVDRSTFYGASYFGPNPANTYLTMTVTNSIFTTSIQTYSDTTTRLTFEYNTVYNPDGLNNAFACEVGNTPQPTQLVVTDNIFVATGTAKNALFYNAAYCLADTNVSYPQSNPAGANAITQDPKFVDAANGNFHLMAGSPAIDAAKRTANDPIVDYDGTTRPQGPAWDIGAFEYH